MYCDWKHFDCNLEQAVNWKELLTQVPAYTLVEIQTYHISRRLGYQEKLLCAIFMQCAPAGQQPSRVSKKRSSLKPCCTSSEFSAAACGILQIMLVVQCVVER